MLAKLLAKKAEDAKNPEGAKKLAEAALIVEAQRAEAVNQKPDEIIEVPVGRVMLRKQEASPLLNAVKGLGKS